MLAQIDVPEFLQEMQGRSHRLAQQVMEITGARATQVRIKAGTDLLARDESSYIWVRSGVLRFIYDGRCVRFFSEGDLFVSDAHTGLRGARIEASFPCDVLLISRAELSNALRASPDLLDAWLELISIETHVVLALCGLYASGELQPQVDFERFESGQEIVREGDASPLIYELIEGSAVVLKGEREVGIVQTGEFIGEIGFLTDSPCVATVVAVDTCLTQSILKTEFARMVQARPRVAIDLACVLARRVTHLNRQLSEV